MTGWKCWIHNLVFEGDEFIVFTMSPNQNEIKFIEIEIEIEIFNNIAERLFKVFVSDIRG